MLRSSVFVLVAMLLALAAGLQKVIKEERFDKLLTARPIMPLGRDIGYLPGDKDEKMAMWMQPVFDNIAYLLLIFLNILVMAGYFYLMGMPEPILDDNVVTVIYSIICVLVAYFFQAFVFFWTGRENFQYQTTHKQQQRVLILKYTRNIKQTRHSRAPPNPESSNTRITFD